MKRKPSILQQIRRLEKKQEKFNRAIDKKIQRLNTIDLLGKSR